MGSPVKNPNLKKMSPEETIKLWLRISSYEGPAWTSWQKNCSENREFYYGKQWTDDEIETLEDRGQFVLAINKLRKKINTIVGLLTANQPVMKAVPVGKNDNIAAELAKRLLDYFWHGSGGLNQFRQAVKQGIVDNIAYMFVKKNNRGDIVYEVLDFDDVVVDPASKDRFFRDANQVFIKRYVSVEYVKKVYDVTDIVYEVPTLPVTLNSGQDISTFVGKLYSDDKNYVKVYEGYKLVPERQPDGSMRNRVQKTLVLGIQHVLIEMLPPEITELPVVPVFAEDTRNPHKLGEVQFIKGIQKFINKAYGIVILNAQLMSNPKIFLRQGDIPDMDVSKFEANYAKPGSINIVSNHAEQPIVIQGQPLNTAFFSLYQDANYQLDSATVPNEMSGYQDNSRQTATPHYLEMREAVLDSFKDLAGNVEDALSQCGKVGLQFMRAYLTDEKVLRIIDEEKRIDSLRINHQEGLNLQDPRSVEEYIRYKIRQGVPEEEVQALIEQAQEDEEILKTMNYIANDVSSLDVDIHVVPGSYAPSYEMANLRLSLDLYREGIVDPETVIEHLPYENRDEIKARFSQVQQQMREIEHLQEAVEEADSEIKRLRKTIVDQGIKIQIGEGERRVDKVVADVRAKQMIAKNRINERTNSIIKDVRREVEREKEAQISQGYGQQMPMSPEDEAARNMMIELGIL